jgi:hypothetical protein
MSRRMHFISVFALSVAVAFVTPARAETRECKPIATLPAVITAPGVYCLVADHAVAMASGNAVTIGVDHVTLDCNGFVIDGRPSGTTTQASGIAAVQRNNVTVRGCSVRGFATGIRLVETAGAAIPFGHLVEDNTIYGAEARGIVVNADHSTVRRNRVLETGYQALNAEVGIRTLYAVDVEDNAVTGVYNYSNGVSYGIYAGRNSGGTIRGNRLAFLSGGSTAIRVVGSSDLMTIESNFISARAGYARDGIVCSAGTAVARTNIVTGAGTRALVGCEDGGGNVDYKVDVF